VAQEGKLRTDYYSSSHETPLWNTRLMTVIKKRQSLDPVWSELNQIHPFKTHFSNTLIYNPMRTTGSFPGSKEAGA
jgi:hypothetical protein